jgi:hypothetical protein
MIIQNAIRIIENPLESVYIVSQNTHDFVQYTFKDGKTIAVDGGSGKYGYLRRCGDFNNIMYEEWSLEDTDSMDLIKSRLLWGTLGKDGKGPYKYVTLSSCETDHLKNIKQDLIQKSKQYPRFELYIKVVDEILNDRKN